MRIRGNPNLIQNGKLWKLEEDKTCFCVEEASGGQEFPSVHLKKHFNFESACSSPKHGSSAGAKRIASEQSILIDVAANR